jgi:leader peptidase (prepilin peptidase)/N-methyltransferase
VAIKQIWTAYLGISIIGLITGITLRIILNKYFSCQDISGQISKSGSRKSSFPALIVLLNAGLYILTFQINGFTVETAAYCLLIPVLLLIGYIDFKTMLIPNWSILCLLPPGLLLAFFSQEVTWTARIVGFCSVGTLLLLIVVVSGGGLGIGDVKLMAVTGFCLGWKATFLALFLGSVIGGITGIGILAGGKGNLKTEIPFGPFLVMGIISSILFGKSLLSWYISLF